MKNIDDPVKLQKTILIKSYIVALFPVCYYLFSGRYSMLLGFVFGLVIATLIFRLRYLHIKRSVDMEKQKANNFIRNRYFIEYLIYFIVLIVARSNNNLHFLATVLGLFFIKFTVLTWTVVDLVKSNLKNKVKNYKK